MKRNDIVLNLARGKKVLHVGFADDDRMMRLHKELDKVCWLTGIDTDKIAVKEARKLGFKVFLMDAERMKFRRRFDIILACDVLEHMNNFGLFLKGANKYCHTLVVTVPNPEYWKLTQHIGHTAMFCFENLKTLLSRHGFRIIHKGYAKSELYTNLQAKVENAIPLTFFKDTIYVIAVKVREC